MTSGFAKRIWDAYKDLEKREGKGISQQAPRSLLHGVDPYPLVGPGLSFNFDFPLRYPATAMVLAFPLALFTERIASILFATVSAGLLAYGVTRDGWGRAWIFFAPGFIVAARTAQWTPLICATLFLPSLGFVLAGKPNMGLAAVASSESPKLLIGAVIGGMLLFVVSVALLATWPFDWLRIIRDSPELSIPVTRTGGFLIFAALLRWKQPEARWLLAFACVPQIPSWYETMVPLLTARTKREMQLLVFVSFLGYVAQLALLSPSNEIASSTIGDLIVMSGFLPALVMVLRRPNEGELPAWLNFRNRSLTTAGNKRILPV